MKRVLLTAASFILMAASAMAQDVYLVSSYLADGYHYCYNVSKNGTVLFNKENSGFSYEVTDIITVDNGDVYFLNHKMDDDNNNDPESPNHWTDVRRLGSSSAIFNCPVNQGIFLRDLAYDNGDIYACGSWYGDDNRLYGYITKNGEIYHKSSVSYYEEDMHGITVCDGNVYTCGGKANSEGSGCPNTAYLQIWKNGQPYARWDDAYSFGYDIVSYNGYLYVGGKVNQNNEWKCALWRIDFTSSPTVTLLKTSENGYAQARCTKLYVDGGNIYAMYHDEGAADYKAWKYNPMKGTWKTLTFSSSSGWNTYSRNVVVNNHGVYAATGKESQYWHNGTLVSTPVRGDVERIAVHCPFRYRVYDLPFEDHFDEDSHWDEWIKYDYDGENGYYSSYWERFDYTGQDDYSAFHRWYSGHSQSGDLVSPAIRIPSDYNAKLSFYSKVMYLEDLGLSEVYVIRAEEGTPLTPENFTEFQQEMIWKMNNHLDEIEEDSWNEFEIDLSFYKGKTIHVVFYYNGQDAHGWFVDDVVVSGSYDNVNEAIATGSLSVMPNPAKDVITVTGLTGDEEMQVYNALGQVVKTARLGDGQSLSVGDLTPGIYFLRSQNTAQTVKFAVQ